MINLRTWPFNFEKPKHWLYIIFVVVVLNERFWIFSEIPVRSLITSLLRVLSSYHSLNKNFHYKGSIFWFKIKFKIDSKVEDNDWPKAFTVKSLFIRRNKHLMLWRLVVFLGNIFLIFLFFTFTFNWHFHMSGIQIIWHSSRSSCLEIFKWKPTYLKN